MAEQTTTTTTTNDAGDGKGAAPVVAKPGEAKPGEGAPKVETILTPKLPVTAKSPDPKESPEFKAFLGKQEQLLKDQRTLREQQEAFERDRGELTRLKAAVGEAKANPMKLLEVTGLTPDQFAEALAKGGPTAELLVKSVNDRVAGVEQKFQAIENEKLEAEKRRQTEAAAQDVQRFVGEVTATLAKTADKYPHVVALAHAGAVAQHMLGHYEKTGKELTVDEAAAAVEQDLSTRVPDMFKGVLAVKPMRELVRKLIAELDLDGKKERSEAAAAGVTVKRETPKALDNSMGATAETKEKPPANEDDGSAWNRIMERRKARLRASSGTG